jgi:hypothetical protein
VSADIDLRQLGASALFGLQEAIGRVLSCRDALKRWDAMTEFDKKGTLRCFELMHGEGTHVILDRKIKCETDTN